MQGWHYPLGNYRLDSHRRNNYMLYLITQRAFKGYLGAQQPEPPSPIDGSGLWTKLMASATTWGLLVFHNLAFIAQYLL